MKHKGIQMPVITIDLVSYDVIQENKQTITIKDCRGSVLGKLDNNPEVTGNRFSDEYKYTLFGENVWVQVFFEDDDIVFTSNFNSKADINFTMLETWVRYNFDAIDSIGYEILNKE